MTDTCTQCGGEYDVVALHWSQSSDCSHPLLSDYQREIITGILMGDGSIINEGNRNPHLKCDMVTKKYLEYVDKEFGMFGKGVSSGITEEKRSEKESTEKNIKTKKNYGDVYRWRSMSHPELQEFVDWYSTGEKVWPETIELTPTTLKHWYCGDGCWNNYGSNNYIKISMSNEVENTNKVDQLFENVGLPSPSNYNISENHCDAEFTVNQSHKLWQYMGEPLPGFEYKWPDRFIGSGE